MRIFVLGFAVACGPQPDESCVHSFYADADGDGHGVPDATVTGCTAPPGYETTHDDCDDRNSAIHPGADELCNGTDDDCDGDVDPLPSRTRTRMATGTGPIDGTPRARCPPIRARRRRGLRRQRTPPSIPARTRVAMGSTTIAMARSTSTPGTGRSRTRTRMATATATTHDGVHLVRRSDGAPCRSVATATTPTPASAHPTTQYADEDEDGFGDPATATPACPIPGWVLDATDCDDTTARR